MSTLVISLIGILVAGLVSYLAFSYINVDKTSASPDAEVYMQKISAAFEIAGQFQNSNGIKPRSIEDLRSIEDPENTKAKASTGDSGTIQVTCTSVTCSQVNICLSLGNSEREKEAALTVAKRLSVGSSSSGSAPFVSGSCGNPNASISSNVVITTSI
jgi:hypothetical protein